MAGFAMASSPTRPMRFSLGASGARGRAHRSSHRWGVRALARPADRVLSSDGSVSYSFQRHDETDERDPVEVFIGEGVEFAGHGRATQLTDSAQRNSMRF
jgi:hypothetical protein